jgi:hypothetical protein
MTSAAPDFVELASVSAANLEEALGAVQGYSKFASMLWIRALGEPTLDGVIVTRWSQRSARALRRFCARHKCNEFLLRIDKYQSRWSAHRGGYIIPAPRARRIVRRLFSEHLMAAMLEPASPHRDLYCLTCVTVPEEGKIIVEVVGPGFDTSDLARSDLLPHERFEILTPLEGPCTPLPADLSVRRTHLIEESQYQRSVEDRLTKIGARLRNPAFPEEVIEEPGQLREDAVRFLRRIRETVLLRHAREYDPIPRSYLLRFVSGVVRMLGGLETRAVRLGATTFSATFTTRRRLVYWDFFPADIGKAHLLYSR